MSIALRRVGAEPKKAAILALLADGLEPMAVARICRVSVQYVRSLRRMGNIG